MARTAIWRGPLAAVIARDRFAALWSRCGAAWDSGERNELAGHSPYGNRCNPIGVRSQSLASGHPWFAPFGEAMMKYVLLLALLFSTSAFAQTPPKAKAPTVGGKRLMQVKPTAPQDCKLVGTVKGIKLWAGDCVASEMRGSTVNEGGAPAGLPPPAGEKE